MKQLKLYLLLALLAATLPATAYDFMVDGLCYNINSDGTSVSVTYETLAVGRTNYYGLSGALYIPASVTYNSTTYSVTTIGKSAFRSCSGLTSVTIPNSVTSIGDEAFYSCRGLTSITIPNSITSIGSSAFDNCSSVRSLVWNAINCPSNNIGLNKSIIENVTIGSNVKILPKEFVKNSKITTVTIPNSVTSIGSDAFYGCSELKTLVWNAVNCNSNGSMSTNNILSVQIGNNVETLPANFVSGSKITTVTIPNSVTTIGSNAFSSCSGLTSVTIPNSVTSIGDEAFYSCRGLTSITIPNSITYIGNNAFYNCSSVRSLVWNAINCPSNGDMSTSNIEDVQIGTNVELLPTYFVGGSKIKAVTIPNSVKSIGNYAFSSCSLLTKVTIPNSVTTIEFAAFANCTGMSDLTIGNSVSTIDNKAFSGCSKLTSLTIPNSVTTIGNSVFSDCTGLTKVTIGNSVNAINQYAFFNCSQLKKVVIPNSVSTVGASAFEGCNGLNVVVIGENVAVIGEKAFAAPALTDIVAMRARPVAIPENTFEGVSLPGVDLHVRSGSKARYEMQAVWQDFPFIVEDAENYASELPDDPGSGIRGDVNGDGQVNTGDVSTIYQIILGQ